MSIGGEATPITKSVASIVYFRGIYLYPQTAVREGAESPRRVGLGLPSG